MSIFKKLTKAAVDAVLTPVDLVKDAASLGGALDGQDEPYTVRRLKKVRESLQQAYEELETS